MTIYKYVSLLPYTLKSVAPNAKCQREHACTRSMAGFVLFHNLIIEELQMLETSPV